MLIKDKAPDASLFTSKGRIAAYFIKFMNNFLDAVGLDKNLKGSYWVMDNCIIHKSKPMIRKIKNCGYRVMYLPPYSPECIQFNDSRQS